MTWLIVAISAYFLLAIVALGDKYLLGERIPVPKVYAFYIGALGILAVALIPFGFLIPKLSTIFLALMAGVFHILALWIYFEGMKSFEASKIVPALGGFLPIFTLGLVFIFSGGKESLAPFKFIAFVFLVLGSIIITLEKKKAVSFKALSIAALAAFLFSLYFVLAKFVYLSQPFISGFIWTRIGAFLVVLFLLFFKEVRDDIFKKPKIFQKKTWAIFLPNEILGTGAFILQNWAVALVPLSFLAFVNVLEGTKYLFLLIFTTILSLTVSSWAKRVGLKERISKEILFQKIIAVLLICIGLFLLSI